jgi:SAM-dependent methyltransferase
MEIVSSKEKHKKYEAEMGYWKGAFDDKYDDTKRHNEMLKTALPLATALKPKTVLTIGDNRGRDAAFFKKMLGCHVIASDLDITKLLPAVEDGYIDECKAIDVEKIDLEDCSIDLVVVKESFHHWPRPMLGFYEILRVAKLGVILIEPYDCCKEGSLKPYIDIDSFSDQYEEVGNYKYQISLREILKASWSLYLENVLVVGFNDPYSTPFKYDKWFEDKAKLDHLGDTGVRQFNLITIFVEKEKGILDLNEMKSFNIYKRPLNPFESKKS